MSVILHTGFGNNIDNYISGLSADNLIEFNDKSIPEGELQSADLVLVGPHATDPIRTSQMVCKEDHLISTMMLTDHIHFKKLKQQLLFTPFISKNISCFPLTATNPEIIRQAANQTKQRRNFAKVNSKLQNSTASVKTKTRIEYLGNFLDQAPIGAILLDSARRIVAMNVLARQLFNVQPLQLIDTLNNIWDNATVKSVIHFLESNPSGKSLEIHTHEQYFEISFASIVNDHGENLDILLFTNITDKKLESERIRKILDALPQMAWTTNPAGEVTYFTEGWYAFTGQTYIESMGNGWVSVIHENDRKRLLESWNTSVAKGVPFEEEARYRRADGTYRWHLVRGTPMHSGLHKIIYWIGTCTDINDQIEVQQRLGAAVTEKSQELIYVNKLLRKSNKDLQEFAFVASHDLKEPLRKIITFLTRAISSKTPEEKEQFYKKSIKAATRMTALIDGIMAYSQLNSKEEFELCNLNELVKSILVDFELTIKQKNAVVNFRALHSVNGIKIQLIQLLQNLIGNSLKYSHDNVQINITTAERKGEDIKDPGVSNNRNYVELVISDNGIGFDDKYKGEIFDLFTRLHNRNDYSGSGIGLALVKKIVENHEGSIQVESETDKGTTFHIYFPVNEPQKISESITS